jgi:hypothetical protein
MELTTILLLQAIAPIALWVVAVSALVVSIGVAIWVRPSNGRTAQQTGQAQAEGTPWAYQLVLYSIVGVIVAFLLVMFAFAAFGIFQEGDAANIAAALSSLFGIVGTLVGTYFGIKTSSEAQGKLESASNRAIDTTQTALNTLSQRSDSAREDLLSSIQNLHAAWNAHNEETVMGFFADNASATLATAGRSENYTSKEDIRTNFVRQYMPGSQVDSRNYRLDGNRVAWESTIEAERFRDKGVDQIEGTVVATFEGGKIISLSFTLSPATQQRMGPA